MRGRAGPAYPVSTRPRSTELHVFGRVSPQDTLRLAQLMQQQGLIVAMAGDAVNAAAALKQADIGVAVGGGSEVTEQAGRMIAGPTMIRRWRASGSRCSTDARLPVSRQRSGFGERS